MIDYLKEFIEKEIKSEVLKWDKAGEFPRDLYNKIGDFGLLGMLIPETYGGTNLSYNDYANSLVEVSKKCGSLGLSIAAHNSLVSQHIYQFGNEFQKRKYLPNLCSGAFLGAWALTEPNAGSDASGSTCKAVETDTGWKINGTKNFITQGATADVIVLIAKTGDKKDSHTAFLIDRDTKGFNPGKPLSKLGMKASETVELFFDDCEIPNENIIGEIGKGFKQAMQILDGGRISIAALSLGIAKGAYETAFNYAKIREQFGKPIIDFQAIGFKLAGLATDIYAAELMLKDVCKLKDNNNHTTKESAMCKLFCSELAVKAACEAVQILGGYGYITDYLVEKHYRDAKLCTIGEGTSEIQKLIITRELTR